MLCQMLSLATIVVFYSIYIGKMIVQKRKGIQTDYIAKGKKKSTIMMIEVIMKFATYSIVVVEMISITLNSYMFFNPIIRIVGIIVGLIGVIVFAIAVYTMKDSWRAGIPDDDKTTMITEGIYGISRNPAFLGFYLTYLGILLTLFNWLLLAFTIFSITLLHVQILLEEKYLPTVFGKNYLEYKKRVRRYIGKKEL
ncbi:MAG: isoprenylcysteine carboxylmethyltransferase family protein [Bacilli bacterium]|nr:isoprenylcysteine carboxylmethyltransferase family protein [Bacilli bacterium]